MNDIQTQVMQTLEAKYSEALQHKQSAANELERLRDKCAILVHEGATVMSQELLENTEDRGIVKELLAKYSKQVDEWAKVLASYQEACK